MSTIKLSSSWEVDIHQLLLIVRDAYVALVPTLEKARIPWANEHAYDDWDRIADSIYNSVAINAILHSSECARASNIVRYSYAHEDYSGLSFFLITDADTSSSLAFVNFFTKVSPFDHFNCRIIDQDYRSTSNLIRMLPLSMLANVVFSCKDSNGERTLTRKVTVCE